MTQIKSNNNSGTHSASAIATKPFAQALNELVQAYQTFARYSEKHIRTLDLTPSQLDVLVALHGTTGLSMGEVARRTLVTKGTLTGIVDRLERKGLVRREVPAGNRRSFILMLTEAGEAIYRHAFPAHMAHLQERFERLDGKELEQLHTLLAKLRQAFD